MSTEKSRPAGQNRAAKGGIASVAADTDVALLRRADSALRAALKEGLEGAEVDRLRDWVAQHRMRLRRARARARLNAVLEEIEGGQDG